MHGSCPDRWSLQQGCHHNPNDAPLAHRELAILVSLGAALALASGHTFSLEPAAADSQTVARSAQQLGLTADDLGRIAAELPGTGGEPAPRLVVNRLDAAVFRRRP